MVQVTSHHVRAQCIAHDSVHGQMQHWLMLLLLGGFSLARQEVQHQVPGDADHPIAPYHVVSGHNQVIAMGKVPGESFKGHTGGCSKNLILEAAFSRLEQQEIICWGLIISSLLDFNDGT